MKAGAAKSEQGVPMIARAATSVGFGVITWVAAGAAVLAGVFGVEALRKGLGVHLSSAVGSRVLFASAGLAVPLVLAGGVFAGTVAVLGGRWGASRTAVAFLAAALCALTLYGLMLVASYTNYCSLGIDFPPIPGKVDCG